MRTRLPHLALVIALVAGACADGDPDSAAYGDVTSLARSLTAAGVTCELEYEGLADGDREVSTCTIDGEFVLLQVWEDRELLSEFLAIGELTAGAHVSGENWIVEVETTATARRVADALGGKVTT